MKTLSQASTQWRSRPNDERFTSLIELNDHCRHIRACSNAQTIASRQLHVIPSQVTQNHDGLHVIGYEDGPPTYMSHWSFGQLAVRAGAPAGYLRDLPAPLAADCVNYGLKFHREIEDLGILTYRNGGPMELRAVTGPSYGRIWNATITDALISRFGDGISGDFRVPGEFGKEIDVNKANTTLYASDRDMFVFLADEKRRIEIPNRRDGKSGSLARGFFVWNSEVGAQSFGIALFLFDYACSNRIVWGAQQYQEIRIRHTPSANNRWLEEVLPAIEAYAQSSTAGVEQAIAAAQATKIDKLDEFLKNRFTGTQATGIKAAHMADEQRPMETLWDVTTGVTAYARGIQYQDERVKLEREAGKILKLSA